jgi:hypothetical protein
MRDIDFHAIKERIMGFLVVLTAVALAACMILTLYVVTSHNTELDQIKKEQQQTALDHSATLAELAYVTKVTTAICKATPGCVLPPVPKVVP